MGTEKKLTTVVFDIGNVLINFDWDGFLERSFNRDERIIKDINEAVWGDLRWVELDHGVKKEEDVIEDILAHGPDVQDELHFVIEHIGEAINQKETAIPWIKELKEAGFRVLFLSNYSDFVRRNNMEALNFTEYMDGGIWSDKVKLIKPDPAIYKTLLNTYNLAPEECVFIDDVKANVDGAIAVGMQAIQYTGYEETHLKLDHLLY